MDAERLQQASYDLAKKLPDMERGFVIQTSYGDITIEATEAAQIIKAVEKVLKRRVTELKD